MAKTPNSLSVEDKRKKAERALLDSWHPHIKNAMEKLHNKFKSDTKFILTESDLKCWLFYFLQEEKPYTPFAVHTEVTHYAEHSSKDKETQEETTEEKHKFRDLSLLCPSEINANEEFLEQKIAQKKLLSKGFQHKAPAIHFELKFVRETGNKDEVEGLKSDIKKIKEYQPESDGNIRDFIIVCGTRSKGTTVASFRNAFDEKIKEITNIDIKKRLRFFLFDTKGGICLKWNGNVWNEINF
jgi:hypothetical protein